MPSTQHLSYVFINYCIATVSATLNGHYQAILTGIKPRVYADV